MDVERLLGPPDVNNQDQLVRYYLTNEVVDFFFSGNPQCQKRGPYLSWDVAKDTVTSIRVGLKRPIRVTEAGST